MVCPGCGELVDGYDVDHLTGKIYHTVTKTVVAADRKSLRNYPVQKEECPRTALNLEEIESS